MHSNTPANSSGTQPVYGLKSKFFLIRDQGSWETFSEADMGTYLRDGSVEFMTRYQQFMCASSPTAYAAHELSEMLDALTYARLQYPAATAQPQLVES
jgi:hypothetical protein